jgi:hypothetical protein
MSKLSEAIALVKKASAIEPKVETKVAAEEVKEPVAKMTKKAKILEALGIAGIKTASQEPNEIELAKMAAYEMAVDSLEKLAYAEQLFEEADYVDHVYVKQASDGSDIELESDGEALEAFLQELESEVDE